MVFDTVQESQVVDEPLVQGERRPSVVLRFLASWPVLLIVFCGATAFFFYSLINLTPNQVAQKDTFASLASVAANDPSSIYYLPAGARMPPPPLDKKEMYALYIWDADCASCSAALSTCLYLGEKEEKVQTIVVVREGQMRKGLFADYPDALVMTGSQALGPNLIVPSPGVMVVADAKGVVQMSATDPKEAVKWLEAKI